MIFFISKLVGQIQGKDNKHNIENVKNIVWAGILFSQARQLLFC